MADRTTTEFPKMGNWPAGQFVNASAAPSPNTTRVKKNNSKYGMVEPATAVRRRGIQERLGAKYAPQPTIVAPNAAEAAATGQNVVPIANYYRVPSAAGARQFWDKRQYGQTMQ